MHYERGNKPYRLKKPIVRFKVCIIFSTINWFLHSRFGTVILRPSTYPALKFNVVKKAIRVYKVGLEDHVSRNQKHCETYGKTA